MTRFFKTLFFILLLFNCGFLMAEKAKKNNDIPVTVDGENVTVDRAAQTVTASGNVVLLYTGMKITADRMIFNIETRDVNAEGNVALYKDNNIYRSDRVRYNLNTGAADIVHCKYQMHPWYGNVKNIEKLDKKLLVGTDAGLTTSDFDQPEFRVEGKTVKVYIGDRIVIRHAVFYIGDVPVFYWPYYSKSLRDHRVTLFVIPGYDSDWGTFVLTGLNWKYDENIKGTLHLDYRNERGFAGGVDIEYRQSGIKGKVKTYFIDERKKETIQVGNKTVYGDLLYDTDRYWLKWQNRQDVNDDVALFAEYSLESDENVRREYFRQEYSNAVQTRSHGSITRFGDNFSVGVSARARSNSFYNVIERLPEVNINIANQKIVNSPFYYESYTSGAYLRRVKEYTRHREYISGRLDTFHRMSFPKKYFNFISVNPFAEYRGTYYEASPENKKDIVRNIFAAGAEASVKFSKTYYMDNEFFSIQDMRHVIQPELIYTYTHEPDRDSSELYQFDWIDAIARRDTLRYGIRNTFQTKRNDEAVDFLNVFVFTDMFAHENRDNSGNKFSNIFSEIEAAPFPWMKAHIETSYNPYDRQFDEVNSYVSFSPFRDLGCAVGQRYLRDYSNQWTTSASLRFLEKWKLSTFFTFEATNRSGLDSFKTLQYQRYEIIRNFHSWEASLSYAKSGDDNMFYFAFWLTGFPEAKAQIGYLVEDVMEDAEGSMIQEEDINRNRILQ